MEGNGYFMPLRNAKRYTPFEFDKMMSKNENRMDTLGKIIDQDIYSCMMADRKTPLVLTPKLILDNSNGMNSIGPKLKSNNFNSQSQQIPKNTLRQISTESFRILQSPRHMNSIQRQNLMNEENTIINNNKELQHNLNDQFTKYDPEEEINTHWKYEGPTGYNTEKKHYPRMLNIESNYRNEEPVKINQPDFNEDYTERIYNNRSIRNNNNYRSQDFQRDNNNYEGGRRSPYNQQYNDKFNDRYNYRYNNYDEENNMDYKNRNIRAFSPVKNDNRQIQNDKYNEDKKDNASYVRRGFYNSQLNFPYDRYDD